MAINISENLRDKAVKKASRKYNISEEEVLERIKNGEEFVLTETEIDKLVLMWRGKLVVMVYISADVAPLLSSWFSD